MQGQSDSTKLYFIQFLRAISALSVVLFHAAPELFPNGFLGVDVFFVISGFVLYFQFVEISEKSKSPINFLAKRSWRLLPALVSTFSFTIVTYLFFATPDIHRILANQSITALLGIANIGAIRYSPDYFSNDPNPLLHTWSLSAEMQVYFLLLCFAMILRKSRLSQSQKKLSLIVLPFSVGLVVSLVMILFYQDSSELLRSYLFYLPFTRILQFSLGCLAAFVMQSEIYGKSKGNYTFIASTRLGAVILSVILLLILLNWSQWDNIETTIFVSIISACAIASGSERFSGRARFSQIFYKLGNESYSIYLIHLPVIYFLYYHLSEVPLVFRALLSILVTLIFAKLQFKYVERVFLKGSKIEPNHKYILTKRKFPFFATSFLVALLMLMFFGSRNSYFGFDENIKPPPVDISRAEYCSEIPATGPRCVYPEDLKFDNTIVLVGDSHAWMLHDGIRKAAEQLEMNFIAWYEPGCRLLFPNPELELQSDLSCRENNLERFKFLQSIEPDVIVVSQNLTSELQADDVIFGINKIKAVTERIILIGQTPGLPGDIYASQPLVSKPNKIPTFYPESSTDPVSLYSSKWLRVRANEMRIPYIDSFLILCPESRCITRNKEGALVYFDRGHLSDVGSRLFTPFVVREVLRSN